MTLADTEREARERERERKKFVYLVLLIHIWLLGWQFIGVQKNYGKESEKGDRRLNGERRKGEELPV